MKHLTAIAAGLGFLATMAAAEIVAPADVQMDDYGAVAESLTGVPGDPANGGVIMKSKKIGNCISCHAVTALNDAPFHGEVGPVMDGVADRWEEAEIRGILVNAKNVYPGTIMPSYYKNAGYIRPGIGFTKKPATEPMDTLLTAQQIEDVVAFLMTLKEE